jgi:hypothetical protein
MLLYALTASSLSHSKDIVHEIPVNLVVSLAPAVPSSAVANKSVVIVVGFPMSPLFVGFEYHAHANLDF